MASILTEKDIFITPNANVSRQSINEYIKQITSSINTTMENNDEAYLIKLHLSKNMSMECLGAFVKQLKQLIDETLDIPYVIVPVGGNCPVSDVTVSKIVKTTNEEDKNYAEKTYDNLVHN